METSITNYLICRAHHPKYEDSYLILQYDNTGFNPNIEWAFIWDKKYESMEFDWVYTCINPTIEQLTVYMKRFDTIPFRFIGWKIYPESLHIRTIKKTTKVIYEDVTGQ